MKAIFQLFLLALLITSCGAHRVYTSGSYGALKSYTEKQHYVHDKTTETYLSGDVGFGKNMQDGGAFDDKKTMASLNLHRNTTNRSYNFYYGLGAAMGTYKFEESYKNLVDEEEKENFYNVSLKTGLNYTYTRPKIDYRFIGLELGYNGEFGNYQDKLNDLLKANDNELIIVNEKSMFTYQFYSEYVFKLSNENAITLGFYAGGLIGIKETDMFNGDSSFSGVTMGLRLNKYTFHLIHENGQNEIRSTKLGLTYQL